jgi:WD40 repeat protein
VKTKTKSSFVQRVRDTLTRPLFGRDVFISYSRQDATAYVRALAEEVRKHRPDASVCIDQWAAKPYETTHPDLLGEARRSSLFIVVASENAVRSKNVAEEIEQFLGTGRYMLAIDVDRKFGAGDTWSDDAKKRLATTNPIQETKEALGAPPPEPKPPKPSPDVVSRVVESITFETQTRRIRRYAITVAAGALVVIGSASGISWWRISNAQSDVERELAVQKLEEGRAERARKAAVKADAAAKDAEDREKTATLKAEREQDISTALGNANEAATLLQQQPHLVRRAADLAVGAMALLQKRKVRNLGADMALRDALQVLPQMRREVPMRRIVRRAVFSPDGRYFAAIDGEDVMLYDTGTGPGHRLVADAHSVGTRWGAIVFSRDSSRIAAAARDGGNANGWIHVWNTKQRTSAAVVPVSGLNPDVLAVSPTGDSIAFASGESFAVHQLNSEKKPVLQPAGEGLQSIAFNKSGDLLVTAGEKRVRIWKSGTNVGEDLPLRGAPVFAQFSPDGKKVAVISGDGLSVYQWPSKQQWDADLRPPGAVEFSPDSRFIAVSAAKGEGGLRIYDAVNGRAIHSIATRADRIAFNADDSRIATGSFHIARLWRVADGRELGRASHPPMIPFVAFRSDGDVVSAGDRLKVWRPNTIFVADRPIDGTARYHAIAFDPLSDDLAITMAANVERFRGDGTVATCGALPSQHAILFTPDGRLIGEYRKQVRIWSDWCRGSDAGRVIAEFPGTVTSLALARDGRTLAIGGSLPGPRSPLKGMVRIVADWEKHPRTIDLPHPQLVFSLAFLPDGNLVSGANDGVRVWNWQTQIDRPIRLFQGSDVRSVAADRTGRWIASAAMAPTAAAALIWDLHDPGNAAAVVIRHDTSVLSVDFDPTGQFLATAGADRMVHVWEGWNTANPFEVVRVRFDGGATQVVFSPDGCMLGAITTEPDAFATITLWRQPELVAAGRAVLAKAERP